MLSWNVGRFLMYCVLYTSGLFEGNILLNLDAALHGTLPDCFGCIFGVFLLVHSISKLYSPILKFQSFNSSDNMLKLK